MAMKLKYEGDFLSRAGVTWTCRIYQESDTAFVVGELDFPANAALVIDWPSTGKEESMCGSSATLTVISPSDRTYEDLYTEQPGSIRLDVLRNHILYWSGALDTEFYEEPYSAGANYEVLLTFTDFGILKRLKYNLSGMQTLQAVLEDALERSGINYNLIDQGMISTKIGNTPLTLSALSIASENFFDEEDEPMDMYSVLESILQPLAIRIVQRSGGIYLYDLNALALNGVQLPIEWCSEDQMLGVDRVFNNVKVTLSVYASEPDYPDGVEYTDEVDPTVINLTSETRNPEVYSYYVNFDDAHVGEDIDYRYLGFSIFLGMAKGLASIYSAAKYYHFEPLLDGGASDGVAYWFFTGGHGPLSSGRPVRKCAQVEAAVSTALMTTRKVFLPEMPQASRSQYEIRLAVPLLLDARYNPFEDAGAGNEEENYNALLSVTSVFVPAKVQLYDNSGNVIWHYENRGTSDSEIGWETDFGTASKYSTEGRWVAGPAAYDDCMLQYYDKDNPYDESPLKGWVTNRQACGMMMENIFPSFTAEEDGQSIPYPPAGGYLEIQICAGIKCMTYARLRGQRVDLTSTILPKVRWFLFQAPAMELLKSGVVAQAVNSEDIEYSGKLNNVALDNLDIDTICGTSSNPVPSARGLFHKTADGSFLTELTRAGRTTQVEQLLIGTLYSQFASRKTKLSGTAALMNGIGKLTDAAQPAGKFFILLGDRQDVIVDESEIEAVELAPDEYTGSEE